jgi:hypothetical protein
VRGGPRLSRGRKRRDANEGPIELLAQSGRCLTPQFFMLNFVASDTNECERFFAVR